MYIKKSTNYIYIYFAGRGSIFFFFFFLNMAKEDSPMKSHHAWVVAGGLALPIELNPALAGCLLT